MAGHTQTPAVFARRGGAGSRVAAQANGRRLAIHGGGGITCLAERKGHRMGKVGSALLVAGALAAGAVCASEPVAVASLSVKERLEAIEVINVTAQKELDAEASEHLDADVAAILAAAGAAEEE